MEASLTTRPLNTETCGFHPAASSKSWQFGDVLRGKHKPKKSRYVAIFNVVDNYRNQLIESRLARLEEEVRRQQAELAELRSVASRMSTTAPDCHKLSTGEKSDPELSRVLLVTQEVFGCSPTVEIDRDPEDPVKPFVVFNVKWQGNAADAVDKRIEWHNRISDIEPGSSGEFRLSILSD